MFLPLPLSRQGQAFCEAERMAAGAAEGFNWIVRICCFCVLIRGLENLGTPLKGFNCCGAKLLSLCADSRFA